jgi:hypothetical protein
MRHWGTTLIIALTATLSACGPGARSGTDAKGTGGDDGGGDGNGSSLNCTADGVDLIYVVDDENNFSSFNPRNLGTATSPFTKIGTLNCPTQMQPVEAGGTVNPFSMSVDRNGTAWVLYSTGEVFKVNITNAACTASGYTARQMNMLLFGMGFVTDAMGANSEKLFLGGGTASAAPGGKLGKVDTTASSPTVAVLGNLRSDTEQSPELTGTSEGKLYGFYPGARKAFVQEINRGTGAGVGPEQAIPGGLGGTASAWAFAFWGGKFYIFVTTGNPALGNQKSSVRVIDRSTGAASTPLPDLPNHIVGAGVSTCAPVVVN